MKKVGSVLKKRRIEKGFTIEEVANACEIELKKYIHIESNKVHPNETLLKKLYDKLAIDELEIERRRDISEEKTRRIIGYVLTLFSLLFLLSFIMKFEYNVYTRSGFYFVFKLDFEDYISVKSALTLFTMQFGYYMYRLITKKLSSNIFNLMTILFSVAGVFFMYTGLYKEGTVIFPFVFLIVLAILTTLVSLAGLILYPLKHDFISIKT